MHENIVKVSVAEDQKDVLPTILDHDLLARPVVDFQHHLVSIVPGYDIIDVMDVHALVNYSKLPAVSDLQRPDDSPAISAKKRLPWLIILLFLGMLTASLIDQFEQTLSQVPLLAIFIPLIAGMARNTGTQSLAVAVRGLATGGFGKQGKMKLMLRETTTGLITGTVCGIVVVGIIFFWKGELYMGMLVGGSLLVTLTVATLSGSIIPLIMDRLKIDPAVASGPFITTINDITSTMIYFGFATVFLGFLL